MTPGLKLTTILYAGGLAVVSAAMLSLLPALKVTRARVQSHLANLGTGGATLRFGRVWTTAMIVQVALTAIAIPVALESASQTMRKLKVRADFPSREYLAARIHVDRPFEDEATPAFEARRARTFAELQRRIAQEPGVVAITFADGAPGSVPRSRFGEVESSPGAEPAYDGDFRTSAVGPAFFEAFDRPIVAGRAFHAGDGSPGARTVIVNEAFARAFSRDAGSGSPIGARLRYSASSATRRDERGSVRPPKPRRGSRGSRSSASCATSAWILTTRAMNTACVSRGAGGNGVSVRDERAHARQSGRTRRASAGHCRHRRCRIARPGRGATGRMGAAAGMDLIVTVGVQVAVTALVWFLSALGIFSLVSVSVSRRTREIGLRAALGANPRHLLAGILSRGLVLMGSGIAAGGALLLWGSPSARTPGGWRTTGAVRRVAGDDRGGDARRVSAGLHRARPTRAQDQSSRRAERGLSGGICSLMA